MEKPKGFRPQKPKVEATLKKIKYEILIISGKGGVGKSTLAVNLAYSLAAKGRSVGLLDVDIHGPSIGKMTGIEGVSLTVDENGKIKPAVKDGVRIVTMASLLQSPDAPVIWRGPLKMKAIEQFLGDIDWGELDYLIIDAPPGTGDEPLSVCQLIPKLTGSVIITTPQDVALLDARKTVSFSRALGVPVIGIVENMSGFTCPYCGKKIDIFKTGGAIKAAKQMNLNFLGEVPLDPKIVDSSDDGKPFITAVEDNPNAEKLEQIAENIMNIVEKNKIT